MKLFHTDRFVLPLPEGHRFPMAKYSLLRERVAASELGELHELAVPDAASDEELLRVHERQYLERVKRGTLSEAEVRRIGFPWSLEMVERSRRSVGGTIAACRSALVDGVAEELKVESRLDMRAASSAESTSPLRPAGRMRAIRTA